MPIIFNCPACGRELEAPDEALGSTGACRFCGAEITAPASAEEPAALIRAGVPDAGALGAPPISQPTGDWDAGTVLSEAWGYLKSHWATLLAALLVTGLIVCVIIFPLWYVTVGRQILALSASPRGADPFAAQQAMEHMGWGYFVAMILAITALAPLTAGPLYLADRLIARGDANFGAIFQGLKHYGPLFQFTLILQVLNFLPMLIQMPVRGALFSGGAPPLWWLIVILSWAYQAFLFVAIVPARMEIVDRGGDAISAIKASWEFTKGHRWMILGTWLLLLIAYMAGVLACCLGVFFTMGFIPLGEVLIYRHLRGLQGTPD